MPMTPSRTKSILIAALGGEGGGVLSDWTIAAIRSAGYLVQGTSIPGVAQRTGATTYYIEYLAAPHDEVADRRPVFALTPIPGRVDVMVASELIEAARAAQSGFISPDRTTLIASSHRIYTTSEKMAMTDGRFDVEAALNAVHALARRAIIFDIQHAAQEARTVINAVLLGTLAGSNTLDIDPVHFENAIKSSGKSVDASLKGYAFGYAAARGEPHHDVTALPRDTSVASGESLSPDLSAFPLETQFTIRNGYRRCQDYQDTRHAETYLDHVRALAATDRALRGADHGWKLTIEGARHLALRMTYEDVIRVADLKSRGERFDAVRREVKAAPDVPLHITEFLKPGPEELCAVLPRRMGDALLASLRKRGMEHRFNIGIHVKSHTVSGYLLLRLLARLRFLRRGSWRFAQEEEIQTRWLTAVQDAARIDYDFGIEVAECADLVKGYSGTYRRGLRNFTLVFDKLVDPAIASLQSAAAAVRAARLAANSDPEGDRLERFLGDIETPQPHARIANG
jgi:indolepyruvate ferredoxin oxidoreductase beta subunit